MYLATNKRVFFVKKVKNVCNIQRWEYRHLITVAENDNLIAGNNYYEQLVSVADLT